MTILLAFFGSLTSQGFSQGEWIYHLKCNSETASPVGQRKPLSRHLLHLNCVILIRSGCDSGSVTAPLRIVFSYFWVINVE